MPEVSVSERDYRAVAAIIRDPQRRDQVASTFIELCKRSDTNSAKYEAAANKLMLALGFGADAVYEKGTDLWVTLESDDQYASLLEILNDEARLRKAISGITLTGVSAATVS